MKMYFLLITIIYCVITQVFNQIYELEPVTGIYLFMGVYIIGLGLIKGYYSEKLKDVFNFRKFNDIYEIVGLKNSLIELLALMVVFINSYLLDKDPTISPFEFVTLLFVFIFVYRFLFWGITQTIATKQNH